MDHIKRPSLKTSTISASDETLTTTTTTMLMKPTSRLRKEILRRKLMRETRSVAFSDQDRNIYSKQDISGKTRETIVNADGETTKVIEFRVEPIRATSERKQSTVPSYMNPTVMSNKQRTASPIPILDRETLSELNTRSTQRSGSLRLGGSIAGLLDLDDASLTQTDLEYPRYATMRSASTIADALDSSHSARSSANQMYEPTYRMEPQARFNRQMAEDVIEREIEALIESDAIDPEMLKVEAYAKNLMEKFTAKVKRLIKHNTPDRYKLLVNSYLIELKSQDLMLGSKCLWDPKNDCMVSVQQTIRNHLILVNLFAVYHE